jgi:hypothetical protein
VQGRPGDQTTKEEQSDVSKLSAVWRMSAGETKPFLAFVTAFCFCLLTVAQLTLPFSAFAFDLFPHCTPSRFVHYPFEEVPSGTVKIPSVSGVQFAKARLFGPPRLLLAESRQNLSPASLPSGTAPVHRRILPPSRDDDYH